MTIHMNDIYPYETSPFLPGSEVAPLDGGFFAVKPSGCSVFEDFRSHGIPKMRAGHVSWKILWKKAIVIVGGDWNF